VLQAVTSLIGDDDDRRDSLALAVSEAVTNAVRHAQTQIAVVVCQVGDRIRVEVSDGSDKLPVLDPHPDGHGGYGLHLIGEVAHDWGVTPLPAGKTIWFEI
jgi:anti-sigma regulatory factor (Ser/Thr protein kinase)